MQGATRGTMRLPSPLLRRIASGRQVTVQGRTLDLQCAALLELQERFGFVELSRLPPDKARRKFARGMMLIDRPPEKDVSVQPLEVSGEAGPLPARLYTPNGLPHPSPLIVFFHGGGMVVGDIGTHDPLCRHLAQRTRMRIVSVAYRLAPEHPFPAAPRDAVSAWRSIAGRASELGGDPDRLVVMGDSAGGNLSAVVAQHERGHPTAPILQVLLYPATELTHSFASHRTFAEGFLLTEGEIAWFMRCYLPAGTDPRDPDASPLQREDISGVAPALVYTAGFDPLRDEGQAYADKLMRAGVRVKQHEFRSLVHGFAQLGIVDAARAAVNQIADDVAAELRRTVEFSRHVAPERRAG